MPDRRGSCGRPGSRRSGDRWMEIDRKAAAAGRMANPSRGQTAWAAGVTLKLLCSESRSERLTDNNMLTGCYMTSGFCGNL